MAYRRAQLPLDPEAQAAADERLWARFPELKGQPLSPDAPKKYRSYWMDQYAAAGGKIQEKKPLSPRAPRQPCPDPPLNLEFRRVYWDGTPVPGVPYTVTLADGTIREGSTDETGLARENDVEPGAASVTYRSDPNPPTASIQMEVDAAFQDLFSIGTDGGKRPA